jgi:hypothetical protein
MDHAEARELMADLLASPADADAVAATALAELDAHLAGCPDCSAEQRSLRATAAALALAIGPPRGARDRVLANVVQLGRQRGRQAAPPRRRALVFGLPRALAAAAAIAVLAFIAGAVGGALLPRDDDSAALAKAAMMMADLARTPGAHTMTLTDGAGAPGGTLIYEPQSQQLVVFSEALARPASGRYGCYVERAGERSWVGPMLFEANAAFWAGPVREPLDLGRPGDRFLVLREPTDPTPMLSGSF